MELLISSLTKEKLNRYWERVQKGQSRAGQRLQAIINQDQKWLANVEDFLKALLRTKVPRIFAESEVSGDGSDWNQEELSILGDVSVLTQVTIFDDGRHTSPKVHEKPFYGFFMFVPGALLQSITNQPADWAEVVQDNAILFEKYLQLY